MLDDETLVRALEKRRHAVAAAIAVIGLVAASILSLRAPAERELDPAAETKKYLRQMQSVGGDGNMLASRVRGWFEDFAHGRGLAVALAGLAFLAAGAAFVLLTPEPPAEDVARKRGAE